MSRRWRYPRSRRGDFYTIIPTTAAPSTPPYVPVFQEPSGRNSRLVGMRARRGRFLTVPLVGAAPPAAPWIPPLLDIRRAPSRPVRRGRFYIVPLVGAAPPPAIVLPTFTRERVRILFSRRGRYWSPPYPQQQAPLTLWVPQITRAHRPPGIRVRRGDYLTVPLPQANCPPRITSRRGSLPTCRRGRTWMPSWIYVPPTPPPAPTSGTASAATGPAPQALAAAGSTATVTPATPVVPKASAGAMTVPTATGG